MEHSSFMEHEAVQWTGDLVQWAIVAPSFVITEEQLQRVIRTLDRMNPFPLSLLRFERVQAFVGRISWA